jgi:signal transduction histidine kinase/DNA-binding response OmpR family regulator
MNLLRATVLIKCFIVFSLSSVFSQKAIKESSKRELVALLSSDTTSNEVRFQAAMVAGWRFIDSNLDSSFIFAEQALSAGNAGKSSINIAEVYNLLGAIATEKGVKRYYINNYFDKALEGYQKAGKENEAIDIIHNKGRPYERDGLYDSAFVFYQQAYNMALEIKDTSNLIRSSISIGSLMKINDQLSISKKYLFKALGLAKARNSQYDIYPIYNALADLYSTSWEQSNLDSALFYAEKRLNIERQTGDSLNMIISLLEIGKIHQHSKNYIEAETYYKAAYEDARKSNNVKYLLRTTIRLGNFFYNKKAYAEALIYLETAASLLGDSFDINEQNMVYEYLSLDYQTTKDYESALEDYVIYSKWEDSTSNNEKILKKLVVRHGVAEKEIENQLLKSSIIRRTILGLSIFLMLILVTIIAVVLRRSNQLKKQQNELLEDKVEEGEQELLSIGVELEETKQKELLEVAKSRFFANVSHELRTSLTLIQASLESILNKADLDNKTWTRLSKVLQSTHQLNDLVGQILDLTKFDAKKLKLKETTEVFYLLTRRTIASFESYAEQKAIKLSLEHGLQKELRIDIDKEKFGRILTNYLSNAIKFTPKGGSIKVIINDFGNNIQLAVIDTGSGVHESDIKHVFERYYQSDYDKTNPLGQANHYSGGTGIGLSMCADYAKLFGGKVWVESPIENGKGSAFYFEFPKKEVFGALETADKLSLDTPIVIKSLAEKVIVNTIVTKKENTILVVEDNFDLRIFIVELLSEKYEVIAAENGQEALDKLNELQNSNDLSLPNLIISDVMMPVVDGFELLNQLKSNDNYRHIPVIMLTARTEMKDKLNALRIGVDDYISKPFHEVELMIRVDNLIKIFQRRVTTIQALNQDEDIENAVELVDLKISKVDAELLENLENYVLQNIEKFSLTSEMLAEALLMSRAKLFRKIKELTGLTLNQYVREVRLQKAKTLLEFQKLTSVKEVVYAVGFKQTNYFTKIYEEQFGKKPSDYFR